MKPLELEDIKDILGTRLNVGDRVLYGVGNRDCGLRDGTIEQIIPKNTYRYERAPGRTQVKVDWIDWKVKVRAKGRKWEYDPVAEKGSYVDYTYAKALDYYSNRFVVIPDGMEAVGNIEQDEA
jgi:hypothetical protein